MATMMELQSQEITDPTGYDYYTKLMFGNNSNNAVNAEYNQGQAGGSSTTGQTVWDEDISDGLCTEWRNVQLIFQTGTNGMQWSVGGGSGTLYTTVGSFNTIHSIDICAASNWEMTGITFRNLSVNFYNGSTLVDSYSNQSGPSVDQSGNEDYSEIQDVMMINTTAPTVNKLVFNAEVQLIGSPDANYLNNPDCVFGNVFVYTA